jgi:hypothetical protein
LVFPITVFLIRVNSSVYCRTQKEKDEDRKVNNDQITKHFFAHIKEVELNLIGIGELLKICSYDQRHILERSVL